MSNNKPRTNSSTDLIRARAVLEAEAEAIRAIQLDDNFLRAVRMLKNCKGKVITTGMGKVGTIAVKVATTLSSTGTPACFLHPGEAAHGDLGLVSKHDVMITFSNSGKTREVLETIARAKKLNGMHLIAITSHRDSPIARQSDVVLCIGKIKEPCPLGLTPSASTTAMLALGDALALVLMEKKKFTKADYAKFHHGGYLGKKARMEAGEESRSSESGVRNQKTRR
ncbi:MAG: SIS domain-containing protein [Deltaproteobacteria bacterium]|nr:SIS domain-containing protein [Deltaproteobacteria bacterium]